jgi:cell division protein FtsB
MKLRFISSTAVQEECRIRKSLKPTSQLEAIDILIKQLASLKAENKRLHRENMELKYQAKKQHHA